MTDATDDDESGSPRGDPQRFVTALDDLKQAGCVVLITGTVDATVRAALSRQLFGASSHQRQRLLIHADNPSLSPASYLPHGITPTHDTVECIAESQVRSSASSVAESTPSPSDAADSDLPSALNAYRQQITGFLADREATMANPGELRVGVFTFDELYDRHGHGGSRTVLKMVGRKMRTYHGIGHCQLPMASERAVATGLAEYADIHVQLREREGDPPEQCWTLRDADCCSAWFPLDSSL